MRVLGVDPGLGRCGWAVVEQRAGATRALGYGAVTTRGDEVAPRLLQLATELRAVVATHQPDSFAIERLFVNANVRTAVTVGQASGVALLVAAEHGLDVTTYTPSQVKRAVVGTGTAPKAQVGYMVRTLLGLDAIPRPADTADALAVALCHLQHAVSSTWAAATPDGVPGGAPGRERGNGARGRRGHGDPADRDGDPADPRGTPEDGGRSPVRGGLAASTAADWLARAAPTSPWRGT
jgi:crossover junction endodeoxyribonuclease RuvC